MKTIVVVACLLLVSFSFAYGDIQIPDSIKSETRQLQNNLDEQSALSIISKLVNHKIITNSQMAQQIYTIPSGGEVDFIKISGRISEFGRTAHVLVEITGPDGSFQTLTSPLLETGRYSILYAIDSKSSLGTYVVQTKFAGEPKSVSYFHLTKTKFAPSDFPPWLLQTFEWWVEEKISDYELVNSVQHLVDLGLIVISEKTPPVLQVVINGQDMVRRGTTHTIDVHVTDGYSPIEGAKVTLVIEDYGENIIREFDGLTDRDGYFYFSWEIPKSFDDIETLLAFISVSGNGSSQTHLWKFQVYCLPGTENCKIDGN